jgi:hypothetical protein
VEFGVGNAEPRTPSTGPIGISQSRSQRHDTRKQLAGSRPETEAPTEGFDTADLKEAKALLDELS